MMVLLQTMISTKLEFNPKLRNNTGLIMANTINTAGGSFADMSRFTELRQRLFFLIGALIVYAKLITKR